MKSSSQRQDPRSYITVCNGCTHTHKWIGSERESWKERDSTPIPYVSLWGGGRERQTEEGGFSYKR